MPSSEPPAATSEPSSVSPRQYCSRRWISSCSILLMNVNDFGGRKTVKIGRGRVAVGADVLREDQVLDIQIREQVRLRNRIQTVTGLTEDSRYLRTAFL